MVDSVFRLTKLSSSTPSIIPPDASSFRLTKLSASGSVGNNSTFRLTKLSASSAGANSTYRMTKLNAEGGIPTALQVVILPNRVISAIEDVYLDASQSQGNFDPDSVVWSQTGDSRVGTAFDPANPTCPIYGSGPTVIIRPDPEKFNYTLNFRVVIDDGVNQATATTTLLVYQWLFWEAIPSGWVPAAHYSLI